MDISHIGNGNYYIIISGEEMRGGDVAELVLKNVSTIREDTVLEIFPGSEGALIFARAHRGNPLVFSFPEFETVITAALLCESDCIAYLAYESDQYRLIYYPWGNEAMPDALYEYSKSVDVAHIDYPRHIKEQGQLLLGPCAIEQLKDMFS